MGNTSLLPIATLYVPVYFPKYHMLYRTLVSSVLKGLQNYFPSKKLVVGLGGADRASTGAARNTSLSPYHSHADTLRIYIFSEN